MIVWPHADNAPVRTYGDGITIRTMWEGPAGRRAFVVDLAAGAVWPELDVHEPGAEEVYVAEGLFNDGVREYFPDAVNATIAAAIARMTSPRPTDRTLLRPPTPT